MSAVQIQVLNETQESISNLLEGSIALWKRPCATDSAIIIELAHLTESELEQVMGAINANGQALNPEALKHLELIKLYS